MIFQGGEIAQGKRFCQAVMAEFGPPGTCIVERENQRLQAGPWPPHQCHGVLPSSHHTNKYNKKKVDKHRKKTICNTKVLLGEHN